MTEGEHQKKIYYALGWWSTVTEIVDALPAHEREIVRLRAKGVPFREICVTKEGCKTKMSFEDIRQVELKALRLISRATMLPDPSEWQGK